MVYKKCFLSCKRIGKPCDRSWRERSSVVSAWQTRPDTSTWLNPPWNVPKTMRLLEDQKPPAIASGMSQTVCVALAEISIFLSLPALVNRRKWLSEDQNGTPLTPSVPIRAFGSNESIERTHKRSLPSELVPMNASSRPFADRAGLLTLVSSGGEG